MFLRSRVSFAWTVVFVVCAGIVVLMPGGSVTAVAAVQDSESETLDRIYLSNGRVIEGRIIHETATEIEIEVVVSGISAPATFQKSEILQIERNVVEISTPVKPVERSASRASPESTPAPQHAVPEGSSKVFHIRLAGHLMGDPFAGIPYLFRAQRRDVLSFTPIQEVMQEALNEQPEVIVVELSLDSPGGFEGLSVARTLQPIFESAESSDTRIVFWVERAVAGAAFLSLMSDEIYFKPDGIMGGVGGIEEFKLGGDTVVDEKQISLRIGRAEGIAIQYGYDPMLVRAMMRKDFVLYVRFRGGKPQYLMHEPRDSDGDGWELLTDDGEGNREDEWSFEGNDYLNLDAALAQRLGVSDGTASTIDDLVYELNIGRQYTVIRGSSVQALKGWQDKIARATDQITDIFVTFGSEDLSSWQVNGTAKELGREVQKLQQARSLASRYSEVFDPSGDLQAQIDATIARIRSVMRDLSKKDRDQRNTRRRR